MLHFNTPSYTNVYGESPLILMKTTFKKLILTSTRILVVVLSVSCAHTPLQEPSDTEILIPQEGLFYVRFRAQDNSFLASQRSKTMAFVDIKDSVLIRQ